MIAVSEILAAHERAMAASSRFTATTAMATAADAAPSVPQIMVDDQEDGRREPHAALEHVEGELALDLRRRRDRRLAIDSGHGSCLSRVGCRSSCSCLLIRPW